MHLDRIKLTHFKNYLTENISFSSKVNCIVGLNGMGKTNLLDAIYYLCMCKSQFGISDTLVMQQTQDFFRLEGHFNKNSKSYKVVAKVIPKQRKDIAINGVVHPKLADHIGLFPVVMITPFDIELAMDGSIVRRRFMDNTLSQIDQTYLTTLLKYNRILRQRNAALKSFAETSVNHQLLDSLDEQLVEPALFIHQKRQDFNHIFLPIFQTYYEHITNGQEAVNCVYRSFLTDNNFTDLLHQRRQQDVILQRSTVGIHKDDLVFYIKNNPLKKFASQGQLKSFILALKLAQYQVIQSKNTITPILLLDDIFDKLDNQRVQQLIHLLFDKEFGQIFFTDTQQERLFNMLMPFEKNACQLVIQNGQVINA